jgi:TPR repeat protein
MSYRTTNIPPPGRGAIRWFLFITFFHLLPVPWLLGVAGGLAPGIFLFAAGITSLFLPESESLAFAAMLGGPALIGGLVFYVAAWVLSLMIIRLHSSLLRTAVLLSILAVCLAAALNPIFVSGGHSSSYSYRLYDFISVLDEFRIPSYASIAYFSGAAVLLISFLIYQHVVDQQKSISLADWQLRLRIRRWVVAGIFIGLICGYIWTHRIMLVVQPLAKLGLASAQYQLALAIKERVGVRLGSGISYHDWLVRAAEQGHAEAALLLVKHPRSQEEKLRWITVAAEKGMADAQYQLYAMLLKSKSGVTSSKSAREWLELAADNQHMQAQYDLGRYYMIGYAVLGIEKDPYKARTLWELAAGSGHVRAMEELARHYEKGTAGFPHDPQRAIELLNKAAAGYQDGLKASSKNQQLADSRHAQAEEIARVEKQLELGDPLLQAVRGRELLRAAGASSETRSEGLELLAKAAERGDPALQYEMGDILISGRHGIMVDEAKGRSWWAKALRQNHLKTMEQVASAYQNGRFGYQQDLLKSKELVVKLIDAYRNGKYGVDQDPRNMRRWSNELKHLNRLISLAGGEYQSPAELQNKAETGDTQAQYQLGRQLMVSGPAKYRKQGLAWIEQAAEGNHAEAQYRLVTYFDRQAGIMRSDPERGVTILQAAAEQNHLPAMSTLALAYYKGRYGLDRDYRKAAEWFERLLGAYDSGLYLGEIDDRFIPFNRQQLKYSKKMLKVQIEKEHRYAQASPLERKIIAVEEQYNLQYQNAVNSLDRRDSSPEGVKRTRAEIDRLRLQYNRQRDEEIARIRQQ